jgi:hypothetical protein
MCRNNFAITININVMSSVFSIVLVMVLLSIAVTVIYFLFKLFIALVVWLLDKTFDDNGNVRW